MIFKIKIEDGKMKLSLIVDICEAYGMYIPIVEKLNPKKKKEKRKEGKDRTKVYKLN